MVNPSIDNDGVIFTFQDGNCDNVRVEKQGTLDITTLPATDSDGTFVIDVNGVRKNILLSGALTDAETSRTNVGSTLTIEQQMAWLLNLVNGEQYGYTFNSTYQTNKTVYCTRVSFDENAGDPNRVPYVIEFVEGG